jgi:hypothetical protein
MITVTIKRSEMGKYRLCRKGPGSTKFCCLGRDGIALGLSVENMDDYLMPDNSLRKGWGDVWRKEPSKELLESLPFWAKNNSSGDNDKWHKKGLTAEQFIAYLRPVFREAGRIIRYYPDK